MQNASECSEAPRAAGALVPAEPPETRPGHAAARPCAAFVTQLVATRDGLPDHRPRRRLEPRLAASRYAAPVPAGTARLVTSC